MKLDSEKEKFIYYVKVWSAGYRYSPGSFTSNMLNMLLMYLVIAINIYNIAQILFKKKTHDWSKTS